MEAALRAGSSGSSIPAASRPWRSIRTARPRPSGTGSTEARAIGAYKRSKVAAERAGAEDGGRARPAGGDRQSLNAHRPARHQAHANGPHHRRGRAAAGCPAMSIPPSISCMSTTWRAGISRPSSAARWASSISWGARTRSLADMLGDIARIVGRRRRGCAFRAGRSIRSPGSPRRGAGDGARAFRDTRRAAHGEVRMVFSSAKAEQELGYRARPYGEGLAEAIDWFRKREISR